MSEDCRGFATPVTGGNFVAQKAPGRGWGRELATYRGYKRLPSDCSRSATVRKSGHAVPASTFRTVASFSPAAAATALTLARPMAARRLLTNPRATSPAGSSDATPGQEVVNSAGVARFAFATVRHLRTGREARVFMRQLRHLCQVL